MRQDDVCHAGEPGLGEDHFLVVLIDSALITTAVAPGNRSEGGYFSGDVLMKLRNLPEGVDFIFPAVPVHDFALQIRGTARRHAYDRFEESEESTKRSHAGTRRRHCSILKP